MKRVLIIKMSSMGDIIHTLPALTDAHKTLGEIQFDWVVEPGFAEIPRWHRSVDRILKLPFRQWRKHLWQSFKEGHVKAFVQALRQRSYDAVIDAQGLMKSALVTQFARGKRFGPSFSCAREPFASLAYQYPIQGAKITEQHAVIRMRQLFANALQYPLPEATPDYGIDTKYLPALSYGQDCVIFLHGTTWPTKHWPLRFWQQLSYIATVAGFKVLLPWGNEHEYQRAQAIVDFVCHKNIKSFPVILPKLSLAEITSLIAKACGVVAVDTGLGHIAAALGTPTVSLYGPTDPKLTGACGPSQHHLQASLPCVPCLSRDCQKGSHLSMMPPCFETLPAEKVWQNLVKIMKTVEEKNDDTTFLI